MTGTWALIITLAFPSQLSVEFYFWEFYDAYHVFIHQTAALANKDDITWFGNACSFLVWIVTSHQSPLAGLKIPQMISKAVAMISFWICSWQNVLMVIYFSRFQSHCSLVKECKYTTRFAWLFLTRNLTRRQKVIGVVHMVSFNDGSSVSKWYNYLRVH